MGELKSMGLHIYLLERNKANGYLGKDVGITFCILVGFGWVFIFYIYTLKFWYVRSLS